MSSTVTNEGPLRRLLPVGLRLGTLVRRAARQGRMGRDHLLNEAEHGPIKISERAIPGTACHVSGTGSEEKEDPAPSKDLLGLWFFFSFSRL